MAGKPIGTIFVELDLDASRYTKGQQQLLRDAQGSSSILEKNFQNLGIKSAAHFDLLRAKIKNSFDMIANSSKATANDIIRAEEAKNSKLKALNDKQFGEQKNHLESLKNNWLAYAASIFAAGKMISQSIEMAAAGSKLEKQAASFVNLANAAGTSSRKMLDDLKVVSRGMIAEAELIGAAGKALLMGIKPDQITKLMEIAAATSKMTGQTMTEAFADITMGVARQSRMILDNLGIIVDADKAYADYAKTLGKSAEALTDIEKRQAFMNAVVKSGDDMIKRLGASSGQLEGVNKLIAAQANLWAEVQKSVASMLDKELSGYAKMINWIDEKLKSMRSSAGETSMKDALKEIEMLRSLESKGMAQPGSTMNKQAEYNRRWGGTSESELASAAAMKAWSAPDAMASWREREGNYAANTEEQNKQILKDREERLKKIADEAKKAEDEAKKAADEIEKQRKAMEAYVESMQQASMKLNSIEDVNSERRFLGKGTPQSDEAWAKEALSWNQNMMEKVAEYEKAHKKITDLSQATAEAMQSNFSDFFFDAFTGKLKTLEDYATAVFQSLARMMSDLMSQQLTRGLFGADMKGGGWLSGMFGTSAANLPINQPGYPGAATFHSGGIVGSEGGPFRRVPAMVFANAPRFHDGIGPGERPAIIRDDEGVFTPGQMRAMGKGKQGGDTYHVYNISAIDSQSFAEAARRSGAVPALAAENYANNGVLRSVLRSNP